MVTLARYPWYITYRPGVGQTAALNCSDDREGTIGAEATDTKPLWQMVDLMSGGVSRSRLGLMVA